MSLCLAQLIRRLSAIVAAMLLLVVAVHAQVDPNELVQLLESIKSDADSGNTMKAREKVLQVKLAVESMCGKNSLEYASVSLMLCNFEAIDSPRTAIKVAKESLAKLEGVPSSGAARAQGYTMLCILYSRLNQPRLALEAGERVLKLSDELPENRRLKAQFSVLPILALNETNRGNYEAAEKYVERLEKLLPAKQGAMRGDIDVTILKSKADLLSAKGDLAASEILYLDCLKKLGVGEESEVGASVTDALGDIYMRIGDYERAADFYGRSAKIFKTAFGRESSLYALSREKSAWVLLCQGKFDEARRVALEVLDIAKSAGQGSNEKLEWSILYDLAVISQRIGDLDAAQGYAEQSKAKSLSLSSEEKDIGMIGQSLELIAAILFEKGQFEKALRANKECSDLFDGRFDSETPLAVRILAQRGKIYRCMGDDDKARDIASQLISLQDDQFKRILSMDERSRLSWQAKQLSFGFEACVLPETVICDTVMRRKGAVLDSVLEDRARAREFLAVGSADKMLREIARIRARVSKLTFSEDPEDRKDAEILTRKASELERSLAKTGSVAGTTRQIFSVHASDVQALLHDDEVLLDFVSYDDPKLPKQKQRCYGVVVLTKSAPAAFARIGEADVIDLAIALSRAAIADGDEQKLSDSQQTIVEKLWGPLAEKIPAGCQKLLIAPDGPLNFLSFAALPTAEGGFLGDNYNIAYLGSGRDLLRTSVKSPKRTVAIFADPAFEVGASAVHGEKMGQRAAAADIYGALHLAPLPGTKTESGMLKAAAEEAGWTADTSVGSDASEARVRKIVSPGVLHLATHGFYLNSTEFAAPDSRGMSVVAVNTGPDSVKQGSATGVDPMRASGIALSGAQATLTSWAKGFAPDPDTDGILTAEEVAALDLGGTWLVTLSACETGVGEARSGEGVFGLRRAFMVSGAQNLLMTLWPVSDETTAMIMKDFYGKAFATGDASQALAQVQREWLEKLKREKGLLAAVRDAGPFALMITGRGTQQKFHAQRNDAPNRSNPEATKTLAHPPSANATDTKTSADPVAVPVDYKDEAPKVLASVPGPGGKPMMVPSKMSSEQVDALKLSAERGDCQAQTLLGSFYEEGMNLEKNEEKAALWFGKAAEQGSVGAIEHLASMYLEGRGVGKNANRAAALFRQAAEKGSATAQFNYAVHLATGEGLTQDEISARKWYHKAAEQNVTDAQLQLGLMYMNGQGGPVDNASAAKWFAKAAEKGNADALNNLGFFYQNGQGVSQNYTKAQELYLEAAKRGSAKAYDNLGFMYANGLGVDKRPDRAIEYYLQAAERGEPNAQNNLGGMYATGDGIPQDDVEAFKWFLKAAENGVALAQCNIGIFYEHGRGTKQNDTQARKWYLLAANQDDEVAQYYLGLLYACGRGGSKNTEEAVKWFRKSAAKGYKPAQKALRNY